MTTSSNHGRPRPSLAGPIILIGIGVLFLLSNLGLLPSRVWPLLRQLWPVPLILIGIEILVGRRSTVGSVISALFILVVVGGLIALLVLAPDLPVLQRLTRGPAGTAEHIQHPLGEFREASVDIDWNPVKNQLYALPETNQNLVEGEVEHFGF